MKALLIGSCDLFMSLLVERLVKEGTTVSIIASADFHSRCKPALQYNLYNDTYTEEGMNRLVRSISPNVMFYAGNIYRPYFLNNHSARGKYVATLMNMLDYAKESHAEKFVYMSSDEVYGSGAARPANEDTPIRPDSELGIICEQAENLCVKYSELYGLKSVLMRFAPIYGFFENSDLNKTLPTYMETLSDREGRRSYVYLKDAAEAAVRVILSGDAPIYNVGGNEAESGAVIAHRITNESEPDHSGGEDLSIDSGRIKKELEWFVHYDLKTGIQEMRDIAVRERAKAPLREKHSKKGKASKGRLRDSQIVWTLETILMFVVAAILVTLVKDDYMFSKINFLVIYILIVSLMHGMRQSILAVVLSCVFFVYTVIPEGMTALSAILNVSNILIIAQMILIGVLAGYTVDRYRTAMETSETDYDYLNREFSELNAINEENAYIKHEYERRLVDYKESLPTLYTIISRLNSTEKEEIYPSAVHTVQDALHAPGVGIYLCNKTAYIRLAASDGNPGFSGKSVNLLGYPDIKEKIDGQEMFVNNFMKQDIPQMIAPIIYRGEVIALVTVNELPFEMLSLHQANMLRAVSAIITIFIVRAGEADELKKEEKYVANTKILKAEAFEELLRARAQASNENLSQYAVLRVEGTHDLSELSPKISACIRENDYIGQMEDGSVALLLTNSTEAEAEVVLKRVREKDIECTILRKESL